MTRKKDSSTECAGWRKRRDQIAPKVHKGSDAKTSVCVRVEIAHYHLSVAARQGGCPAVRISEIVCILPWQSAKVISVMRFVLPVYRIATFILRSRDSTTARKRESVA
jgi:hypothetical protein